MTEINSKFQIVTVFERVCLRGQFQCVSVLVLVVSVSTYQRVSFRCRCQCVSLQCRRVHYPSAVNIKFLKFFLHSFECKHLFFNFLRRSNLKRLMKLDLKTREDAFTFVFVKGFFKDTSSFL